MTSPSLSPNSLQARRADLKSQRRRKLGQSLWRFLAVSGMAFGLAWSVTLPYWVIRDSKQVEIEGDKLLSQAKVLDLLSLSYPQSVWKLPTYQLSQRLSASPPLVDATITRTISPPRLLVKIQERQPVAIAYQNHQSGYIDQEGVFIAKSFYEKNPQQLPAFSLKVFGYGPQYQQYWPEVYNLIKDFPVKVSEINWQNPSNLVLTTELGKVYLGAISPQFGRQLKQLGQLRSLSSYIPISEIVYIDLSNLEVPTVQLKQKPEKKSLNSLVRKQ